MKQLKIIELFGGIGAFTQALKKTNIPFEIIDYVEIDKYAVKSYNAINGTSFSTQNIVDWDKDVTDIDILMHGSPCQDFSIAGRGKGGDEGSGTRSSLMYETLRIVDKVKPRIVIWENVKGLLSPKHRHNYDAYLQRMSDMGYTNFYQVLNAKDYGVPQNRERIFTVSFLESGIDFKFPEKQELKIRLRDILENWVDDKFYLSDKMMEKITWDTKSNEIIEVANLHKGGERGPVISPEGIYSCLSATEYEQPKQIVDPSIDMIGMLNIKGNEQVRRVYGLDGISPTLNTMGGKNRQPKVLVKEATKKGYAEAEIGDSINLEQPNSLTRRGRVGHGVAQTITTSCQQAVVESECEPSLRIRKLTPLECWRLMGFDDDVFYKAQAVNSNTQLYKQAGNSIVVNVLFGVVSNLLKSVEFE